MGKNLVTGGLGAVGIYLVRDLLERNEEVVIFETKAELPPFAADVKGKAELIKGDVGSWVQVIEAVRKYNISSIYHLATLLTHSSAADPQASFRTNVVGMMNVLEAARIFRVKDLIFTSSCATYGQAVPPPKMVYNDTLQRPDTMYGINKLYCERLGEQYHRQYGVNFRSVRYSIVSGPGRSPSHYFYDWSGVIEKPARGKPYTVHVDPLLPCGYMYVKDASRVLIELKDAQESKLRQRVYNVDGFLANITEVANTVKKYIPDAQITFDWDKSEDMKTYNRANSFKVDNMLATEDFGYEPRYLLDEMVADFIEEVRKGKV